MRSRGCFRHRKSPLPTLSDSQTRVHSRLPEKPKMTVQNRLPIPFCCAYCLHSKICAVWISFAQQDNVPMADLHGHEVDGEGLSMPAKVVLGFGHRFQDLGSRVQLLPGHTHGRQGPSRHLPPSGAPQAAASQPGHIRPTVCARPHHNIRGFWRARHRYRGAAQRRVC